ncbi:MAG: PmoA family protein [Armatimonadota bacterium]|nr:PmoA family protein [Armatimonadota bacterium]
MRAPRFLQILCVLTLLFGMGGSRVRADTLTVSAPESDYRAVPVSILLRATPAGEAAILQRDGAPVPCQLEKTPQGVRVWWVVRDLKRGDRQSFQLSFPNGARPPATRTVQVRPGNGAVEITVGNQLFTRYVFGDGPKPYCYPLLGPGGIPVTRNYPMKEVEGEPKDHPHQRSFWFTHGSVNGVDFWAEGPKMGKTVHREFGALVSGPVFGLLRATNDWTRPDGTKVCTEEREIRVFDVGDDLRLFDFATSVKATEGPLVFGDTKEGSFGFRLAPTMQVKGGQGHIENARGDKDGAAWGKRAEWCDYYGPVQGHTLGIAIFDTPSNPRYPTYWHVRDYGLFAVNPFGLKDFTRGAAGDGTLVVPAGEALTLRYRVLVHRGTTAEAAIAQRFAEYVSPPKVEAKP